MNKNRKGFTLVELVIVSTIMVMILGAILNFIQPINRFYNRTLAISDANDVGTTVMSSLESELRYATNVLVLEDYEGVPKVKNGHLLTSDDKINEYSKAVAFTDVIVIDNNNVRGSVLSDYDPESTTWRRKGATGQLMQMSIGTGAIDLNKLSFVSSEALYSDFKTIFNMNKDTNNKNLSLRISMQLIRPEFVNGTGYVFRKTAYNQVRDMELVNINKLGIGGKQRSINSNWNLQYFTNRTDSEGHLLGDAITYDDFGKESIPVGLTSEQQKFYDGSQKFTYVFYTKDAGEKSSAKTIKVKLMSSKVGGVELASFDLKTDESFEVSMTDPWLEIEGCKSYSKDGKYYTMQGFKNCADDTELTEENYGGVTFNKNVSFYPFFNDGDMITYDAYVEFYAPYTSGNTKVGEPNDQSSYTQYSKAGFKVTADAEAGNMVSNISTPDAPDGYKFIGWYPDVVPAADAIDDSKWFIPADKADSDGVIPDEFAYQITRNGTTTKYTQATEFNMKTDYYYYAVYEELPKYHVTYRYKTSGGNIVGGITYDVYEGKLANTADVPSLAGTEFEGESGGKNWRFWKWENDEGKEPKDVIVTSDVVFDPVYKEVPKVMPGEEGYVPSMKYTEVNFHLDTEFTNISASVLNGNKSTSTRFNFVKASGQTSDENYGVSNMEINSSGFKDQTVYFYYDQNVHTDNDVKITFTTYAGSPWGPIGSATLNMSEICGENSVDVYVRLSDGAVSYGSEFPAEEEGGESGGEEGGESGGEEGGSVSPSTAIQITQNGSTNNWGQAVYLLRLDVKNSSSSDVGEFKIKIKMTGDVDAGQKANIGPKDGMNCTVDVSGDTIIITVKDGLKAGQSTKLWTNNDMFIYKTGSYDANFKVSYITVE